MNAAGTDPRELADLLLLARRTGKAVPRPANLDLPKARTARHLCIEALTTERLIEVGAYKVSLSTGTWGALPSDAVVVGDATLARAAFNDPLLEGEIAFLAEADLEPGCTVKDVIERCLVAPAIEIADSRWEDWSPSHRHRFVIPSAAEIEADNAVAGMLVISGSWTRACDVDLPSLSVEMHSTGQTLAEASFRDVMGNPANAVRWLAEQIALEGRRVRRGQIVSSGCPHHTMVVVPEEGGRRSAFMEGLGTASVTFT